MLKTRPPTTMYACPERVCKPAVSHAQPATNALKGQSARSRTTRPLQCPAQWFVFSRNIGQVTPEIVYFRYLIERFSGSKQPTTILFNSENRSTGSAHESLRHFVVKLLHTFHKIWRCRQIEEVLVHPRVLTASGFISAEISVRSP